MVKAREITLKEVECPGCGKSVRTTKEKNIQCFGCGKRFNL